VSGRDAARRFWASLSDTSRWLLGDQLVLGDFDWRDWFEKKPTPCFLNQLDDERMSWEASA
jgi:hypothetical protein